MRDTNAFDRSLTRRLKQETKCKNVEWVEWSTSEEQVKSNLREGKKMTSFDDIFVAYKIKD